jgi:hypothetical protein
MNQLRAPLARTRPRLGDVEDWMPLLAMQSVPDPRVMDGEIWEELTDAVRMLSKIVDRAPADPMSRAAGFRYVAR